jgi:SpoVK/Ycf46/Vps4 family AAA+-type ATPase
MRLKASRKQRIMQRPIPVEKTSTSDSASLLFQEFALDRETPGLSMESRMLTTAMLTAINDLRRNQQSIFFVATNRLRAFDSAITRPGRFDLQLFVGTPNLDSRMTQFQQKLSEKGIDEVTKMDAMKAYHTFLDSVWSQDAMFMNYLEGMQFASACADAVISNGALSKPEMSAILSQQAAVMTVRGSAREEFVASMELSRL